MGTREDDLEQNGLVGTFVSTLATLGWFEQRNIQIERRWANGDADLLRRQAGELVAWSPDVIFSNGTPATTTLRSTTSTTPVVFINVPDPVGIKLVSSLASPVGNFTGFSNYEKSVAGKWVTLLKEAEPDI